TTTLSGVVVEAIVAPAMTLERTRIVIRHVVLTAPGVGLATTHAGLTEIEGLTIRGMGPSIVWQGDRLADWRWVGFDLESLPRGLPGVVPPGPGAHPDRLPPVGNR
ncbi:MAG: hypothetical protein AAB263_17725, partial [Planctomycetota bacterium]